jgi:hypothetical protein
LYAKDRFDSFKKTAVVPSIRHERMLGCAGARGPNYVQANAYSKTDGSESQ